MPSVVLERPKMSRAMWEALKTHIMRERQRKKQELEADAEVERQRKERERQQKQDSMTLSETREQISKLDAHLTELKDEKHQLFLQLKKVLNEDETRRRQLLNKEASEMLNMHGYLTQPGIQISGGQNHQLFLQPVMARAPLYKVGPVTAHPQAHTQHTLLPPGTLKRSRSPSPPPGHNYKFGPFKPPPHALHAYPHKPAVGLQYFHTPVSQSAQHQHHQQLQMQQQQQMHQQQQMQQQRDHQAHITQVTYSSGHHQSSQQPPALYTYTSAPPARSPQTNRDESPKMMTPSGLYLHPTHQLQRGFVLHQPMETKQGSQQQKFSDDNPKYYPPPPSHQLPIRQQTHMSIHPGLSIQSAQGDRMTSGSITSGYPIRSLPSGSSYQTRPSSPHVVYSGQSGSQRLAYSHPNMQHGMQPQQHSVSLTRYPHPPVMTRDPRDMRDHRE